VRTRRGRTGSDWGRTGVGEGGKGRGSGALPAREGVRGACTRGGGLPSPRACPCRQCGSCEVAGSKCRRPVGPGCVPCLSPRHAEPRAAVVQGRGALRRRVRAHLERRRGRELVEELAPRLHDGGQLLGILGVVARPHIHSGVGGLEGLR
jgi:hypothetical protein